MEITTDPEVKDIIDKAPETLDDKTYLQFVKDMDEYGYEPVSVVVKRSEQPSIRFGIPVKLRADWDAEVKSSDIIINIRRKIG